MLQRERESETERERALFENNVHDGGVEGAARLQSLGMLGMLGCDMGYWGRDHGP